MLTSMFLIVPEPVAYWYMPCPMVEIHTLPSLSTASEVTWIFF